MLFAWLGENWFTALQSIGIAAGLFFAALNFRADARERRVENIFAITSAHREIWRLVIERENLHRIFAPSLPQDARPTVSERLVVTLIILHLHASFRAQQVGFGTNERGLVDDLRQFISRPIPALVWQDLRNFQDADFVEFIERSVMER